MTLYPGPRSVEAEVTERVLQKLKAKGINPTLTIPSAFGPPVATGLAPEVATRAAVDFFGCTH